MSKASKNKTPTDQSPKPSEAAPVPVAEPTAAPVVAKDPEEPLAGQVAGATQETVTQALAEAAPIEASSPEQQQLLAEAAELLKQIEDKEQAAKHEAQEAAVEAALKDHPQPLDNGADLEKHMQSWKHGEPKRDTGPTLALWVAAGYKAEDYPPKGYNERKMPVPAGTPAYHSQHDNPGMLARLRQTAGAGYGAYSENNFGKPSEVELKRREVNVQRQEAQAKREAAAAAKDEAVAALGAKV